MATAAGADMNVEENLQQPVQEDHDNINIAQGLDSSAGQGRQLLEPHTPSSAVEPPRRPPAAPAQSATLDVLADLLRVIRPHRPTARALLSTLPRVTVPPAPEATDADADSGPGRIPACTEDTASAAGATRGSQSSALSLEGQDPAHQQHRNALEDVVTAAGAAVGQVFSQHLQQQLTQPAAAQQQQQDTPSHEQTWAQEQQQAIDMLQQQQGTAAQVQQQQQAVVQPEHAEQQPPPPLQQELPQLEQQPGQQQPQVVQDSSKAFCAAGEPCTVCHEDFVAGGEVLQLPCRHCFHEACLTPWLHQHNTCPVCRYELEPDSPTLSAAGDGSAANLAAALGTTGPPALASLQGLLDIMLRQLDAMSAEGPLQHTAQQQQQLPPPPQQQQQQHTSSFIDTQAADVATATIPPAEHGAVDDVGAAVEPTSLAPPHAAAIPTGSSSGQDAAFTATTQSEVAAVTQQQQQQQQQLLHPTAEQADILVNLRRLRDRMVHSMRAVESLLSTGPDDLDNSSTGGDAVPVAAGVAGVSVSAAVAGPLQHASDLSQHVSDHRERLRAAQLPTFGNSSSSRSRSPSLRSGVGGMSSSNVGDSNAAAAVAAATAAAVGAAGDPGADASAWVLDQAVGVQDNLGNLRRAMARLSSTSQPVQLSSIALGRASLIPPPTGRLASQRPPTPDRRHSLAPSLDGSPAVTPSRLNSGPTPFSSGRQPAAAAAAGTGFLLPDISSSVLAPAGGSPVLTGINSSSSSSSSFLPPPAVRTSLSRRSSSEGVLALHGPGLIGGSSPLSSSAGSRPPGYFSPSFYSSNRRSSMEAAAGSNGSSSQPGSAPASPSLHPAAARAVFSPRGFTLPPAAIPLPQANNVSSSSASSARAGSPAGNSNSSSSSSFFSSTSHLQSGVVGVQSLVSGSAAPAGVFAATAAAALLQRTIQQQLERQRSLRQQLQQQRRTNQLLEQQLLQRQQQQQQQLHVHQQDQLVQQHAQPVEDHRALDEPQLQQQQPGLDFLGSSSDRSNGNDGSSGSNNNSSSSSTDHNTGQDSGVHLDCADAPINSSQQQHTSNSSSSSSSSSSPPVPAAADSSSSSSRLGSRMARLQSDLAGLMTEADAVLASPPAPLPTQLDSRRQQIEALTAAITATTATLRAHSAAAAASSAVLERERRLVAAETALMATQAAVLRRREAQLLLQAETLRGSMAALHDTAAEVLGQQHEQQDHHQQEHQQHQQEQHHQQQQDDMPEPSSAEQSVQQQQQQQEEQHAEGRLVMLPQQVVATGAPYMQSSTAAVAPGISDTAATPAQPASLAGPASHPLELDSACGTTPTGVNSFPDRAQGTGPE